MEFNTIVLINILITSFYSIFLALFSYQFIKQKRSVPYLLLLLISAVIGGIFAIIDSSNILPTFTSYSRIYLIFQLVCYGLQFFFFYLFMEHISEIQPKLWRLAIILSLIIIQNIALWEIVWFSPLSQELNDKLWLIADFGYNNLAIFAFLIVGVPIYFKSYKYTREKKAIGFIIGLLLAGLGYVINSIFDYVPFFIEAPAWFDEMRIFGEILPLIGLLLFLITYIIDVDYIYRLPRDHFMLMVTYKGGTPIHSVKFETKREAELNENLISGLISSLKITFDQLLQTTAPLETISSKDASILLRSGDDILVSMLAEHPTAILTSALDKYVVQFEEKFEEEIKSDTHDTTEFEDADKLIEPIFPFLEIKRKSSK